MSFPTIIAFSSGARKYHEAALDLRDDCGRFKHPHRIHLDADLSEHFDRQPAPWKPRKWACRYIPTFMLRMLDALDGDVLYVHADFTLSGPIPVAWDGLDIGLQERWRWVPESDLRPLAAPIYARNNADARRFLRLWESYCLEINDGNFEHQHLWRVTQLLQQTDRSLRIGWFEPHIASLVHDADVPLTGHKGEPPEGENDD